MSLALALVLGGVVAGAAYAESWTLLAAVVLAQVLLAAGWRASGEHADGGRAIGAEVLALATGIGVAILLVARSGEEPLVPAVGVLGAAVVGLFVHQLFRRERTNVMASLSSTATVTVVAMLPALYLPVVDVAEAPEVVGIVAVGAAAARAADVVAKTALLWWTAGLAGGVLVGIAGAAATTVTTVEGLLVGLIAGAASQIASLFAQQVSRPATLLTGALPIAVAGPVAYATSRVLSG